MKATYKKPMLEDLGDLRDLTAASANPVVVDVPQGTPVGSGPVTGSF